MPQRVPRPTPRRGTALTVDPPRPPAPMPNHIYASWFPAIVTLPGGEVVRKAKVFAADTGLYVFGRAPDNPRDSMNEPTWYAPVAYDKTPRPPSGTIAASGFTIETEYGTPSILPQAICAPCSAHRMKSWTPPWASVIQAWPDQVEQEAQA